MAHDNPGIMHHVSIGTNDFPGALAFYDRVMQTIGATRIVEFPGAVAYGKRAAELWVQIPIDGNPATCANGSHFAFIAPTREAVHAFYEAAMAAGGSPDGEPGPRPDYGPDYYGCFVRDPDGHKIEAAVVADPAH